MICYIFYNGIKLLIIKKEKKMNKLLTKKFKVSLNYIYTASDYVLISYHMRFIQECLFFTSDKNCLLYQQATIFIQLLHQYVIPSRYLTDYDYEFLYNAGYSYINKTHPVPQDIKNNIRLLCKKHFKHLYKPRIIGRDGIFWAGIGANNLYSVNKTLILTINDQTYKKQLIELIKKNNNLFPGWFK